MSRNGSSPCPRCHVLPHIEWFMRMSRWLIVSRASERSGAMRTNDSLTDLVANYRVSVYGVCLFKVWLVGLMEVTLGKKERNLFVYGMFKNFRKKWEKWYWSVAYVYMLHVCMYYVCIYNPLQWRWERVGGLAKWFGALCQKAVIESQVTRVCERRNKVLRWDLVILSKKIFICERNELLRLE